MHLHVLNGASGLNISVMCCRFFFSNVAYFSPAGEEALAVLICC